MPVTPDVPSWLKPAVCSAEEAFSNTVRSKTRLASGLATSEPVSFYRGLWRHIQDRDLTDIEIRQGLFLTPHPILVGDALEVINPEVPAPLAALSEKVGDLRSLRRLSMHLEELERRRISFVTAFLGPAGNTMIPDNPLTRLIAPRLAGRNRVTAGFTRYHPVHFPDAARALAFDDDGQPTIDLFVAPMSRPDTEGRLSFGLANGVGGDAVEALRRSDRGTILLYLNRQMPLTYGPGQTLGEAELSPLVAAGRLHVVLEDEPLPGMPAGSLDDPSTTEQAIADAIVGSIVDHLELHRGRALQVGIGRTSAQVVKALSASSWNGRGYTEMLDPFTYDLLDDGTIDGTHVIEDGRRRECSGLACTFAMGEVDSDFASRLNGDRRVIMMSASRLLEPVAFHGGLGINNILGIDFSGNVNATARDAHPYSGVGGLATIMRGLSRDGIAYLCLKSTHRGPDGERRSSIMPALPASTAVTLTAPDLLGCRGGRIYLATEHGLARLHNQPIDALVRSLISVAHPDFREELEVAARERYGMRF